MLKVKGKYNTANIYASIAEPEAIEQVRYLCDQEWVKDSNIAIMADIHAGAGCTIGTTMTLHGAVNPELVGVDIGCGVLVVGLGKMENLDLVKLDEVIKTKVPSGRNIHNKSKMKFGYKDFCMPIDKELESYFDKSLGTLGGGNHYIEVGVTEKNDVFLMIHTGSRKLGHAICQHYVKLASESGVSLQDTIKSIVEMKKAEGKEKEIAAAIREATEEHKKKVDIMPYITGSLYENYLNDMELAQEWATNNRGLIAGIICDEMNWTSQFSFETVHNYIDVEEGILRKGSVSAKAGEVLIIPMNMRDGALICEGKGNKDYNYSAPHGAGRLMSRKQAKAELDLSEFHNTMSGIYSTSICATTLDEAPAAYKPMSAILDNIKDTVEIINVVKPVYNYKDVEERTYGK